MPPAAKPERVDSDKFKIDWRVNILGIIALVLQTLWVVAWAGKLDERVIQLENTTKTEISQKLDKDKEFRVIQDRLIRVEEKTIAIYDILRRSPPKTDN